MRSARATRRLDVADALDEFAVEVATCWRCTLEVWAICCELRPECLVILGSQCRVTAGADYEIPVMC
jgi:hypothetical protein